jgi:mRNA-degrading endonuclease toxin of MazEF toxin-antitoxin module
VVSPDSFNTYNEDLVLVAATSQISNDPGAITLDPGDVFDGSLPKPSVVRLTKIFTLHSSLVVKRLCRLKQEKRDELLREIRAFFE